MELAEILWKNWRNWAAGGLDAAFIEDQISEEGLEELLRWLDAAYAKAGKVRPLLTLKRVVDIGTWCLYGTHSLDYHPRPMAQSEYKRSAASFGIPTDILIALSLTSSQLPETRS